jgi:O-methyltransferase
MAKRDVIGSMFRKRVDLFDLINNSSDFYREKTGFFAKVPCLPDRMQLHQLVIDRVGNEAINYLEFGVWQGESFRKWLAGNPNPESRFAGFDTFMGLPEDWTADAPKGTFSTGGTPPAIEDPRGEFVVGLFQDTLNDFIARFDWSRRLVVHVDCDLYSSTLFTLASLDRLFAPGTILIFDDFSSLNHEYQAWRDYQRAFPHAWEPLGTTAESHQAAVELRRR